MRNYRITANLLTITVLTLACSACLDESAKNSLATGGEIPIAITSPAAAEVETSDATIDLAGTAKSSSPIDSVRWENDRGGQGTASGTESWTAANVPLVLGQNTITVTVTDETGASNSDSLMVTRESTGTSAVTISWQPPTERTNGTLLTNLAGYRIYYGRMSETYDFEVQIANPGVLSYVVDDLTPGEWFFAAAAYDGSGNQSDYSEEASATIL